MADKDISKAERGDWMGTASLMEANTNRMPTVEINRIFSRSDIIEASVGLKGDYFSIISKEDRRLNGGSIQASFLGKFFFSPSFFLSTSSSWGVAPTDKAGLCTKATFGFGMGGAISSRLYLAITIIEHQNLVGHEGLLQSDFTLPSGVGLNGYF
ncbi:MAG: hypothetical protein Q7S68_04350 [Deltaproteobacteria bacterium]|nr:hypothetical protein [Deltaproteobacteria bacterium]